MRTLKNKDENLFVLFADDDTDTLELYNAYCDLKGWAGQFTRTASGIVDLVNENIDRPFDVIVSDINFTHSVPRLTGISAALELRKKGFDIPILFITAFVNSLIKEEVKRVGAEIMEKPVDFEKVFQGIRELASIETRKTSVLQRFNMDVPLVS